MTCSPYQHVPGTPSLNKSFTFKLTEFHRATPGVSLNYLITRLRLGKYWPTVLFRQ